MVFAIDWHESAMDLHVFPILNPPPLTPYLSKAATDRTRAWISSSQGMTLSSSCGYFFLLTPQNTLFFLFPLTLFLRKSSFVIIGCPDTNSMVLSDAALWDSPVHSHMGSILWNI